MEENIYKLKAVANKIQAARLGKGDKENHANSFTVIDMYHKWRTESEDLFEHYFDESNSNYKIFKSLPRDGNGFTLMKYFDQQLPIFNLLIKKIEVGEIVKLARKSLITNESKLNVKTIFISHSTKDKLLVDHFVEKILILGCGLTDEQIFCTSIEGLGIKTGEDFREHIRCNLKNAEFSFLIISDNYRQSEVCNNEMGASWAMDKLKIKQFLVPNLNFESLGLLLNIQQAAKINDPAHLDEVYEELTETYGTKVKIVRWNKHKADFLSFLQSHTQEEINSSKVLSFDYFNNFIKENISINNLLLETHPSLLDCKAIFSEQYYKTSYEYYCAKYERLGKDYLQPLYPKYKFFRITKTNTSELMKGVNKIAGGMVEAANKGYFKYDAEFYKVTFLTDKDAESGNSYKVFCNINGRWVFFSRPWQLSLKLKIK